MTVIAPDQPGLLWRSAGVLALHRLGVRSATATSIGPTAVTVFEVEPTYFSEVEPARIQDDMRRAIEGGLDVAQKLARREASAATRKSIALPPARVLLPGGASDQSTVIEVRAHDRPGLAVHRDQGAGRRGPRRRSARVETLGAEVVDAFYVTDRGGRLLAPDRAESVRRAVEEALTVPARAPRRSRAAAAGAANAVGRLARVFDTLSDRLESVFKTLRGKGRLSEADIDATDPRDPHRLLEADVALSVVRDFIAAVKERSRGAAVSQALNPAQQVISIVNEELVRILGGETRRLRFAKNPPTVIMLAGLQGSGKTTLAGKLAKWLAGAGPRAAAGGRRPTAAERRPAAAGARRAGRRPGVRARTRQRRRRSGRGLAGGDRAREAAEPRHRASSTRPAGSASTPT